MGGSEISCCLPAEVPALVRRLRHFIVENEKATRKFLKLCGNMPPYDSISFYQLDKHTSIERQQNILKEIEGKEVGIISDAGCPAVADPGASFIRLAHDNGFIVKPLVGPSAVLLTLMASGMNGQGFTFHGYLPPQSSERQKRIIQIEQMASKDHYTHLFIETPYRNEALTKDILQKCHPQTRLCIAIDLTLPTEEIFSAEISHWRKKNLQCLKNHPAVFAIWVEI